MAIIIKDVTKRVLNRQPESYQEVHNVADAIEIRMARAYVKSVERLQESISIDELALALSLRKAKFAIKMVSKEVENVLLPIGTITRDATLRGGHIGAKEVNKNNG